MRRGLLMLAIAGVFVIAGGFGLAVTEHLGAWRGLYCSVGTATTAGCDVTAATTAGRLVTAGLMLLAIPFLAAGFAEITAKRVHARMSGHLAAELDGLRQKVSEDTAALHLALQSRLERHHQDLLARMDVQHAAVKSRLNKGFGEVIAQADANAQRAADGPAKGAPGGNPGSEGLNADGPVVPAPAARTSRPRTRGTARGGET